MSDHVDPYRCYLGLPTPDGVDVKPRQDLTDVFPVQAGAVQEELNNLLAGYGAAIWFGQRHCAPSPTWRDESVMERDATIRFATRVHLFEKGSTDGGRYLGFVTLRPGQVITSQKPPGSGFQYVLDAELVPPRHMLRPRYHVITTTSSSARLGVLPFRSAVFVATPYDEHRRSTCVHAAISQALHLTMGRLGARPISHREFDAILWTIHDGSRSINDIAENGASLSEALKVVQKSCNAGGFIARLSCESKGEAENAVRLEALRCITDSLANGLPVILQLDYGVLKRRVERQPDRVEDECFLHASLILGMHLLHSPAEVGAGCFAKHTREDESELPGRLVGHDILRGPFAEWPATFVLDAALNAFDPKDRNRRGIQFLALGPLGMTLGLDQVRQLSMSFVILEHEARLRKYAVRYGLDATHLKSNEWRFVTRMIDLREAAYRYFEGSDLTESDQRKVREELRSQAECRSSEHYWSVEVRHPAPTTLDGIPPVIVFIWNIAANADARPCVLAWTEESGRLRLGEVEENQ